MSGLAALMGAAASSNDAPASDDDYEDEFEAAPTSPERKTAQDVLRPRTATSPIRTGSRGRSDKLERNQGDRRRRSAGNPALRGSVNDLTAQSTKAREDLLRTSLPAFMKSNFAPRKKKGKKPKKPDAKFTKTRMNDLSKPKQLPRARFTSEEDAKNCRFKPKISRKSRNMVKHADNPDAFIYRMEAANYAHRNDLERRRAEEEYNARVDKKECPNCHVPQTYAEVEKNSKKCERCDLYYRPKKTWAEVQDSFLNRLETTQVDKAVKVKKLQDKLDRQLKIKKKRVYDPETGTAKPVKVVPKSWKEVRNQFLKRMEDDAAGRQEKKEKLISAAAVDPECTFQPTITAKFSGEVAPFEERTQEDIERRRAAKEAAIAAQKKPPPKVIKSRTRKRVSKAVKSLMASKALRGFSTMK